MTAWRRWGRSNVTMGPPGREEAEVNVEKKVKISIFRLHIELCPACEGETVAATSLSGVSGARLADLPLILSEAASLNLAVVGLALNLRLTDLDHEENLARIKAGLEVVAMALCVCRQHEVEVERSRPSLNRLFNAGYKNILMLNLSQ